MNPTETKRHTAAMLSPQGPEVPIVLLYQAIKAYQKTYENRYQVPASSDAFLSQGLAQILHGFRTLLNGDTGRLNCCELDSFACENLERLL